MAYFDWGNRPIYSTNNVGQVANPSTATLVAEIDSTQLGTVNFVTGQSRLFRVLWILGSDTSATWQCERAASTALNSGYSDAIWPKTGTALSAEFMTFHELGPNDR